MAWNRDDHSMIANPLRHWGIKLAEQPEFLQEVERRMGMNRLFAALCATSLLAGCSFTDDALLPSLFGESDEVPTSSTPATTTPAPVTTAEVPAGSSGGTYVSQKVASLRGDLVKLQQNVNAQTTQLQQLRGQAAGTAQTYQNTVAAISAKLQVGTTRGNPILVQQWNQAQGQLNQLGENVAAMNMLSNDVAANAALAQYILEAIRATYGVSGAVDEDHRQLRALEDEAGRTTVYIDRLLNEVTADVSRQSAYLTAERGNLTALGLGVSNGDLYGVNLATRAVQAPVAQGPALYAPAPVGLPGSGAASGRPLVAIRFDSANVKFEQPLYEAVSRTLERKPNAAFDLVGVAPNGATPAETEQYSQISQRNLQAVLRALTKMGLPADRINLSSVIDPSAQSPEVRLFVR